MKPLSKLENYRPQVGVRFLEREVELSSRRLSYSSSRLLASKITAKEANALQLLEKMRPASIRAFDQIPMRPYDLLRQVKMIMPKLESKDVAFVGDHDGTSILIGLLSASLSCPSPRSMLLVDFDERLLDVALKLADRFDFSKLLKVCLYNVFDALPSSIQGQYNFFYTNPPYSSRNNGMSAELFITRGIELMTRKEQACGCIILPDDMDRSWTRTTMLATQRFLTKHGWYTFEKLNTQHNYRLDDDPTLTSSTMIVLRDPTENTKRLSPKYARRKVGFSEIPRFYGRTVRPPYPKFIRFDGNLDFSWRGN